jgi:hypothetical protein
LPEVHKLVLFRQVVPKKIDSCRASVANIEWVVVNPSHVLHRYLCGNFLLLALQLLPFVKTAQSKQKMVGHLVIVGVLPREYGVEGPSSWHIHH